MCAAVPRALRLLGHPDEDLCLHLCFRGPPHHHLRLLHADGPPPEERPAPFRLTGEGPQPAAHHPPGAGGRGGFRGLLDPHPHLHPGQSSVGQRARDHRRHGRLLLLRGSGLHQQQPEPHPLRLPGRELQAVLQGLLLPQSCGTRGLSGGEQSEEHPEGPHLPPRRPGQREAAQARMTSHGHALCAVPQLGGLQ